jgi:hypothetical protein
MDDRLLRRIGPFATVTSDGDHLTLRVGPVVSRLEHWQYDTFRAVWDPLGQLLVQFTLDSRGHVERLRMGLLGEYERVDGSR